MTKRTRAIFAHIDSDLPAEEKFDTSFRQQRIEATIRALSSVVPDLASRVLSILPRGPLFTVMLSDEECQQIEAFFLQHERVGEMQENALPIQHDIRRQNFD